MAVNINRGEPKKYSSSNRIGSLIGNGLLTFIDYRKKFNHFFKKSEIVFYNNSDDLSEKLKYFKKNESERKKIAYNGQKKYFELFNEIEVAKYIVKRSLNSNNYEPKWEKYIN